MPNSELINYLKKRLIKGILHIFWIFPVEENKITLLNELSFTYGDSLKYIDQYLYTHKASEYKVVFAVKEGYVGPEYDVIVKPNSYSYFKELLTSGTIITNAGGVSYLPKRKSIITSSYSRTGSIFQYSSAISCIALFPVSVFSALPELSVSLSSGT